MYGKRVGEADNVEVRFRGSKGEAGGDINEDSGRDREAVELLAELIRTQGDGDIQLNLPLIAYRSG